MVCSLLAQMNRALITWCFASTVVQHGWLESRLLGGKLW